MSLSKIFKKVLIPCAAGVANAADSEGHTYGSNCVKRTQPEGTKPSDLPIYSKDCLVCREASQTPPPAGGMEETVGNIRRELWVWQDNLKGYRHKIIDVYRRGFSKADCPEKQQSRNHLENSFDEKAHLPLSCPNMKKPPRPATSAGPKFQKLCLDRCGRPCSGEHQHHSQCQPRAQTPQCQPRAQTPQCQPRAQSPPCEPKARPPPCPPKAEAPPANKCQSSSDKISQKPYLCGPSSRKPPPSEGSEKKNVCCCHMPECSGKN